MRSRNFLRETKSLIFCRIPSALKNLLPLIGIYFSLYHAIVRARFIVPLQDIILGR
jgi:hypothetical protein